MTKCGPLWLSPTKMTNYSMKVKFKICKLAKKVESAGLKTQESIPEFSSRSEESTNIHVDTC